ncbi:MAG: hypothetical protein Q4E73_07110 [Lachnospiraceae bacterium]|nr:hypothetical protein [Lachnospiraceae bacterium]
MKKIDKFMKKNDSRVKMDCKHETCTIVLGTDMLMLPDFLKEAMKYYSEAHPHVHILICRGNTNKLYQKLQDGSMDIVLTEGNMKEHGFHSYKGIKQENMMYRHSKQIYIVWKDGNPFEERDRFVIALKKGNCSLKSGYCDYMD